MPHLLRSRPIGMQVLLAGCVPLAFGALCGWLLGVNKTAYLIAAVPVAIVGGFLAGLEHESGSEAAIRGFIGGSLFGGGILILHEATGKAAKVKLPHPASRTCIPIGRDLSRCGISLLPLAAGTLPERGPSR